MDNLFWVLARRFWADWKKSLLVVTPETVVRWHRAGFRLYWSLISRVKKQVGRTKTVEGNPESDLPDGGRKPNLGGSPHPRRTAHAGLQRIRAKHFPLDEVSAQIQNLPSAGRPLFAISHERRQILHVNVTRHPTSPWIAQQLREAFPYESALPDFCSSITTKNDGLEVPAALRSLQIKAVRTSIQSPWQNGVAERWVGSCRRDLLDHIIALNERHLKRLVAAYTSYYHDDRTHLSLRKETPGRRIRSAAAGPVICHTRLGGLHHRYNRAA